AWLGYRIAALRRYRDPRGALTMLEEVAGLATDAGDRVLAAGVLFLRGNLHCYVGEFGPGLDALVDGAAALDALVDAERERLRSLGAIAGFALDVRQQQATLVMRLAGTGRFGEACRVGEPLLGVPKEAHPANNVGDLAEANAVRGLAIAHAALGQPDEARRGFARARSIFQRLGDHFHVGMVATQELQWIAVPYRADRPAERVHLAALAEQAWARAGAALADLPARFARLPLLFLEGDWAAARELALIVHARGGSYKATATRVLALLTLGQGDRILAQRLIQDELPDGPHTPVGTVNFSTVLLLQRLAAVMALDAGDPREAREWLDAHDRWLAWSGAVLGRAEGQLGWAAYHRAVGNHVLARQHAEDALSHANEPRQPLALLAAHRWLGELATVAHRYAEADTHLEQALALANACSLVYERALTLIAVAELRLALGERGVARTLVDEARGICGSLNARPALARADALAARLVHASPPRSDDPAGLTAREVEVLRLIAAGQSNREIAASLVLSERTVEKHIAHVYAKIGARGRADAVAYAVRRGLLPASAHHPS
ncbi:MAG TPA: LuxR C-terminal-related transcriptional regulator, partial [Chloroflexota bacterium]|nr:LuxR C-terminal-related transcriptional regulator [Chloroflexota bacterium]